ncbi:MAG: Na/Pi cotransporter family protein [Proteobacteria bacterium]|nr:Na/Pi cotransporter family protein [Pseudomonadota bacterium]
MIGTEVLLLIIGGVALLVWGIRMVRTGVTRALGPQLRKLVATALRNRFRAFFSGLAAAVMLQSSTAVAMIVGSFAGRGLIGLSAALAVMLGADVGTTIAAQLLAFRISSAWPVLAAIGVIVFLSHDSDRAKGIGRIFIGLALMLLALQELSGAAAAMRDSQLVRSVLAQLGAETALAMVVIALLTYFAHSSLAIVLFIMSLAGSGAVSAPVALVMVLGANIGGAFSPWTALAKGPAAGRRMVIGNLALRGMGALVAIPFTQPVAELLGAHIADPARLVVSAHMLFNLVVALFGLIALKPLTRLLERYVADDAAPEEIAPRHLDPNVLDTPSEALACAMRETLGLGERVGDMMKGALGAILGGTMEVVKEVEARDDAIDRLHEAIKLYLVQASKAEMSDEESRRYVEILTFTMNLEHIGDIIDKNLMELAAKKVKNGYSFSPEGMAEIEAFHARVMDTMRLALNVFATRDVGLARRLIEDKIVIRSAERDAAANHFARLKDGRPESIETSAIHLDVIRDLKRIIGHLTSVAYPILEAEGELAETRLRVRAAGRARESAAPAQ